MNQKEKVDFFDYLIIIIICLILFSGSSMLSFYKYYLIIALSILVFFSSIKNLKVSFFIKPKYNYLLIIINLYLLFSIFISFNKKGSLEYVFFFLLNSIIVLFLRKDKSFFLKLLKGIKISSIIVAISIFCTVVNKNFMFSYMPFLLPKNMGSLLVYKNELVNGNYSGIMFERAYAATGITLGISIVIAEIIMSKKIKKNNVLTLSILFLALFSTGKRMLLLINFFNFLFSFLLNNPTRKDNFIKILQMFILLFFVVIISINIFPSLGRVFERFTNSSNNTIETRSANYWQYCIRMFKSKPLFGYGINSFTLYVSDFVAKSDIYNAHNIYFQLLGETGIVGVSLFLITFLSIFKNSIKFLKKSTNEEDKYIVNTIIIFQLVFLIYGLSGNTLYYYSQLLFLFIAISMLNNLIREENYE